MAARDSAPASPPGSFIRNVITASILAVLSAVRRADERAPLPAHGQVVGA